MAITIDQFLRDLTERELLSTEDAHTVRKELTASKPKPDEADSGSGEHPTAVLDSASLVLCDCLIQDKLHDDEQHLVFNAQRLRDDSAVTIHVLMPESGTDSTGTPRLNGTSFPAGEMPSRPKGITDVGRHGEMMFICCESLEAETLEQVVLQNGMLPLELATETLLQTARTLKRLGEQGFSPQKATPQTLLLDEDGCIHLMGNSPGHFLGESSSRFQNDDPLRNRLFESLGQLYAFLVSGRSGESAEISDFAAFLPVSEGRHTQVIQSAKRVYAHLMGQQAASIYGGWDELIQDLERLLHSQESLAEIPTPKPVESQTVAASETIPFENRPALASTADSSPSVKTASHAGRWVMIALALVVAGTIAAITLLGK